MPRRKTKKRQTRTRSSGQRFLVDRHQLPTPRLDCGRALAARRLATAVIDLSDGLASDLRHLCDASLVGAEIDLRALPISPALRAYAVAARRDPIEYVLTSGEDYELLCTVAPSRLERVLRLSKPGVPITPIGRILPRRDGIRVTNGKGERWPLHTTGYEHFRD